jgi:hypothetical protein
MIVAFDIPRIAFSPSCSLSRFRERLESCRQLIAAATRGQQKAAPPVGGRGFHSSERGCDEIRECENELRIDFYRDTQAFSFSGWRGLAKLATLDIAMPANLRWVTSTRRLFEALTENERIGLVRALGSSSVNAGQEQFYQKSGRIEDVPSSIA